VSHSLLNKQTNVQKTLFTYLSRQKGLTNYNELILFLMVYQLAVYTKREKKGKNC